MSSPASPRRSPRFPPPPSPDDPAALSRLAVRAALRRGFAAAGVVAGVGSTTWERFRAWLDAGLHGGMDWLERDADARRRFDSILPFTRSAVVVAREVPGGPAGNVARYARGEDYHAVVRRELKRVADALRTTAPRGTHFRACVDTAPLLERELAVRAGLGFVGKNGLVIVPGCGSHVVLGVLLTDVEMEPTAPGAEADLAAAPDRCGECRACLDACPTEAFLAPRLLDARRCISYLTIEKRGPFEPWEAAALAGNLFGCDACQDACPWNARPIARRSAGAGPGPESFDLREIAAMDEDAFERRFGRTALWRATHAGLVRNARALLAAADGAAAGREGPSEEPVRSGREDRA